MHRNLERPPYRHSSIFPSQNQNMFSHHQVRSSTSSCRSNTRHNNVSNPRLTGCKRYDQQTHKGSAEEDLERTCKPNAAAQENHLPHKGPSELSTKESSLRHWKFPKPRAKRIGGMKFVVMSYNILSQRLLDNHRYLYRDGRPRDLDWSVRGPALMEQFGYHNADVLCLQEMQENHWEQTFKPQLTSRYGYEGFYMKRTGDKPDGCAILFKRKKFTLLQQVPVRFQRGGLLDRDNVGLILVLRPRKGNVPKICVATTHLLFNPKRGDIKLAQLMLFLAEIEKCAFLEECGTKQTAGRGGDSATDSQDKAPGNENRLYCPIILCGDFNLEPNSPLYRFLTEGFLRYDACTSQELSGQEKGSRGGGYYYVQPGLLPEHLGINDHCQYVHNISQQQPSRRQEACYSRSHIDVRDEGSGSSTTSRHKQERLRKQGNTGQACHHFNFKSVYPNNLEYLNLVTTHHHLTSCTVDYIFYSSGVIDRQYQVEGDRKRKTRKSLERNSLRQFPVHLLEGQGTGNFQGAPNLYSGSMTGTENAFCCAASERDWHSTKQDGACGSAKEGTNPSLDLNHSLEVVRYWSLLSSKQLRGYPCLPNHIFPSDHICLVAEFALR